MGLEGAVRLSLRKQLEALPDDAARDALVAEAVAVAYERGKAISMASYLELDAVIDPADTRAVDRARHDRGRPDAEIAPLRTTPGEPTVQWRGDCSPRRGCTRGARLRVAASRLAELPPGDEVLVVGGTATAAELRARDRDLAGQRVRHAPAHAGQARRGAREAAARSSRQGADRRVARRGNVRARRRSITPRRRAGRFAAVCDQPGLPRALARTLGELRLAGATSIGEPLDAALAAFADEARAGLADRADVLGLAAGVTEHALFGHHVVMLDVPIRTAMDRALVATVAARSRSLLATIPAGDDRTIARLGETLGVACENLDVPAGGSLERVQRGVFGGAREVAALDDSLAIFSAPGESRECVEIARRIMHAAETGVPFDRMAILLRAPAQYRVHLEEALARAGVPAYFEHGTVLPDPAGRAFLALLSCAAEGLSARRFAEYLSLGEVPGDVPAPAAPRGDRWVPPDEELLPRALAARGRADRRHRARRVASRARRGAGSACSSMPR